MAISYPITLPSTPGNRTITITARSVVGVFTSPFTLSQQVYAHQGNMWQAMVNLPPMKRDTAAAWCAALTSLNGRQGTFYLGDSSAKTPRGVATGTPLVKGASQTGKTLITDGWTNSTTGILKAGDYFQVGNRLHMVMQDANSNGSGEVTLEIWPRLRESPTDNGALTLTNPKGLFRLEANQVSWDVNESKFFGISFAAMEAI